MPEITEQEILDLTRDALADTEPFMVITDCASCWMIVSALQLAWRHPGLDDRMKDIIRDIGGTFSAPIMGKHPESFPVLEMGWDTSMDVPNDEK